MLEKEIEAKMRESVKAHKGLFIKFISPSMVGVPDRIVITPQGRIIFVELKRKNETATPMQKLIHKRLRAYHVEVRVVAGLQEAMDFVKEVFPE